MRVWQALIVVVVVVQVVGGVPVAEPEADPTLPSKQNTNANSGSVANTENSGGTKVSLAVPLNSQPLTFSSRIHGILPCNANGVFPDPTHCSHFYRCWEVMGTYQMAPFTCNDNTVFFEQAGECKVGTCIDSVHLPVSIDSIDSPDVVIHDPPPEQPGSPLYPEGPHQSPNWFEDNPVWFNTAPWWYKIPPSWYNKPPSWINAESASPPGFKPSMDDTGSGMDKVGTEIDIGTGSGTSDGDHVVKTITVGKDGSDSGHEDNKRLNIQIPIKIIQQ